MRIWLLDSGIMTVKCYLKTFSIILRVSTCVKFIMIWHTYMYLYKVMKTVEDFTVAVSRLRQVYQRRGRWRGSLCCHARRPSASTGPAQQTSQIDAHFCCNTEHHTSTILFIDA